MNLFEIFAVKMVDMGAPERPKRVHPSTFLGPAFGGLWSYRSQLLERHTGMYRLFLTIVQNFTPRDLSVVEKSVSRQKIN